MRSDWRLRGLSHGNNTAALPPMLLGDFETAQQAQNAVMASYACGFALAARHQPPQPEIAEHWHGVRSPNRLIKSKKKEAYRQNTSMLLFESYLFSKWVRRDLFRAAVLAWIKPLLCAQSILLMASVYKDCLSSALASLAAKNRLMAVRNALF